jgi:hypothetical protein
MDGANLVVAAANVKTKPDLTLGRGGALSPGPSRAGMRLPRPVRSAFAAASTPASRRDSGSAMPAPSSQISPRARRFEPKQGVRPVGSRLPMAAPATAGVESALASGPRKAAIELLSQMVLEPHRASSSFSADWVIFNQLCISISEYSSSARFRCSRALPAALSAK